MLVRAMREKEQELAGLRVPERRQHTLEGSLAECRFRQLADVALLPVEAALARLRNEQGRSV